MAEKALKKLSEQLLCAICLEVYTDPKQLQCGHVYCQDCLLKLVATDEGGHSSVTCPNCRLVTVLPGTGVPGLQSSFQVNSLLEIQDSLKQEVPPASMSGTEEGGFCPAHSGEELKLYCQTCEELICFKCAIKTGRHHSHSYDELAEALGGFKGELASSLGPIENQLTGVIKALRHLDTRCEEVFKQQGSLEAAIGDAINQFHDWIEVRKTELVSELHRIAQGKLERLTAQREQLELTQAQLISCIDFMKQNLNSESGQEVMKAKSGISNQVRQMTRAYRQIPLKPSTEADMEFSASTDIKAAIQNYGSVTGGLDEPSGSDDSTGGAVLEVTDSVEESSLPDPSKCYLTGEDLLVASVDSTSVVTLHVINCNTQACTRPVESISCELVSEIWGTTEQCEVRQSFPGQYAIRYKPTSKGRHKLHVRVNGCHIYRSPLTISAVLSLRRLGDLIRSVGDIRKPWGVAVMKGGEVVVTEHEGHSVLVLSPSGRKLLSFGGRGCMEGQFQNPRGVAIDKDGAIVVADYKNNRLQKFSPQGKFVKSVGTKGSGPLQFKGPKGIAFNSSNGKLYVVDENHRVEILNSDFSYYGSFGRFGSGKGHFNDPWDVACDSTGRVFVADSTNNRVQVFAADGMFLSVIGKHGKNWGEFVFPAGVAVGRNDVLYVSERYNHRISVFSPEGKFVTSFGGFGIRERELKYPRGLAVDISGVLYVCDNNNNRLSLF